MKTIGRSYRYSINYVIKILYIFLLPVVLLDILISVYAIHAMRTQTVQSLLDTTSIYISRIDTTHTAINKYLIRCLTDNPDFITTLETEDPLELICASERVHKDVDIFLESFDKGYQIFIYNQKNDRLFRPTEILSDITQEELEILNSHLISRILHNNGDSPYTNAWEILTLDSGVYFYKFFYSKGNYAGCFISAEHIIQPLKEINLGKDGFIALTAKDGTLLTNRAILEDYSIHSPATNNPSAAQVYTSGHNLIISGAITMGVFRPLIILNKFNVYEKIIVIQFIMAGAAMLITTILFGSMLYMKQSVLKPIKQFSENLSRFDNSMEVLDFKDTKLIELEQANLQFKNLIRQIKKLKIDLYEEELEKQKTLMNYLQLQIRPHFFLNCLNTIYSMAQTQLYDDIMKMTMITSNYFRYIFQNAQDFVPLSAELEHIKNYMEIQKLRYGDSFAYNIYTEPETAEIKILPILIQTFVENSIKHSAVPGAPLTVGIDVEWAFANGNSQGNIQIQITDTGKGFPEDILKDLNSCRLLTPIDGHRIGITNAIKRLQLFYKEGETAITFSNLPSKGACITILLPAHPYTASLQEDI